MGSDLDNDHRGYAPMSPLFQAGATRILQKSHKRQFVDTFKSSLLGQTNLMETKSS
jgi:hypothetical protein